MKWVKRVLLFVVITLAGHILENAYDKVAASASAHPLSYWLHFLPPLSNGYVRLVLFAALFFGGMSLRDYVGRIKKRPKAETHDGKLPAIRPRVIAVQYGSRQSDKRSGLFLVNEGEPAYDISVPSVQFGSAKLVFHASDIPRLVKSDGEQLCEASIEQSPGHSLLGNGLFSEMIAQHITEIEIPIRYKDGDNIYYVTTCKIERDVTAKGGLAVRYVHQRLTSVETASPARIKVSPVELFRTIRLHGKVEGRHIFLRAKVELIEPLQASVTGYRMELSRDGVLES